MSDLPAKYRYAGSADAIVRARLRKWPQHPPGVVPSPKQPGTWLRARPGDGKGTAHPFLKLPGSSTFRTLPDGMWLHFGTDPDDPWCDILAIEACSSLPNLLDKRARFAPSTTSTLVCCPLPWLLDRVQPEDPTPRWKLIRLLRAEPTGPSSCRCATCGSSMAYERDIISASPVPRCRSRMSISAPWRC